MMGAERRSMVMTEEEKKLTAYHEAGHAIVTINEKAAHPIHKATIIPRGRALGMVMQLPERDELISNQRAITCSNGNSNGRKSCRGNYFWR